MKVAVTGASGFIGRHAVNALLQRSISPVLVLREGSVLPEAFRHLPSVQIDVQDPPDHAFERMGRPDVLLHTAWGGLPNYKSRHHFETELPAHYRFLSSLVKAGLSRVVTTGTCFEYGILSGPLHEDMDVVPTNPYGFAKDTLRRQLQYLQQDIPFSLVWARLFYLYGEGQATSSLLPKLKQAVAQGQKVFDMSGGEQLRDYLPVEEIAETLVALALSNDDIGVVNICSGVPISVRKLVENWISENHWEIDLNLGHFPYPDYEPMAFWGSRAKLDACLRRSAHD